MQPSTKQIIDGIAWVLDERVAPRTEDKWAASYLRSVKGLLLHLSVRVEQEGEILWRDITDQREVLAEAAPLVDPDLKSAIEDALSRRWFDPTGYRSVAMLEAENLVYRELINRLVEAAHEPAPATPAEHAKTLHGLLLSYLRRQLERERPLYAEPFAGLPF